MSEPMTQWIVRFSNPKTNFSEQILLMIHLCLSWTLINEKHSHIRHNLIPGGWSPPGKTTGDKI